MEELMNNLERAVELDIPSTYCMQDYDGNGFSFKVVPRGGKPGFPNQFGYSVLFWREFSDQQAICSRWFPAKTSARHRANQLSQDILAWVSATRTKGKKEKPIGYAVYHQTGAKTEHDNDKNDDSNTTADEVKFVKSNSSYMLKVLSHLDDYNVMGRSPEIYVSFPIYGYSFMVSTSDKSDTIKLSYSISLDENLEYSFKKDTYPGRYMADVMLKCIYRIIKKERTDI